MNLRKSLTFVLILSLCGAGLAFGQDNVLEKARQKYDRNKTAAAPADAPAAETPAAPAETPKPTVVDTKEETTTASSSTTTTSEDGSVTVDVNVKVKVKNRADQAETAQAAEAAPEEKPAGHRHFFAFQFVPGLPHNYSQDSVVLGFSPVMIKIGTSRAVEFSLFLAAADQVRGLQLAGLGNFSSNVRGLEAAGIFNIGEQVRGLQLAGVFNTATESHGLMGSGLFNVTGKGSGIMSAGLFNVSGDFNGLQAAGLFNVGHKVKGVQLGLINISDDLDGLALGLINYSRTGINEIDTWYESNNMLNVGLMTGSRHFYTLVQGGMVTTDLFKNTDSLSAGYGVGFRVGQNEGFHFQTDISARSLVDLTGKTATMRTRDLEGKGWHVDRTQSVSFVNPFVSVFPSVRLGLGLNFGKFIGIFGGVTFDIQGGEYWSVPDQFKSPIALMVNYKGYEYGAYAKLYAGIALL